MDEQTVSLTALAIAFGEAPESFASQFVEQIEGEENPKPITGDALTEKLKAVFSETRNRFLTEGKKAGARERMSAVEEELRAAYGAQYKQQGKPLVDAIVAAERQEAERLRAELDGLKSKGIKASDLKGLSDEDAKAFIANHPFHAESLASAKAEVEAKEAALEAFKQQVEAEKVTGAVQSRALELLETEYRPKLTGNAEIDKRTRQAYLRELLETAKYKVEEGKITALDAHGDVLKNPANYLEMTFDQLALNTAANWFERHPVDPNKQAPGASAGKGTSAVTMPDWSKMTTEEINARVLSEPDAAKMNVLLQSATAYLDGKR